MSTVLFIPTASVKDDQPSDWLKHRLDAAITYYRDHTNDTCSFVPAGRWNNPNDSYLLNEAEVCRRYIQKNLPNAKVYKEDLSVDTAGGYAFAKPIIANLHPDKVVIINSAVLEERNRYFAKKIFGTAWPLEFIFVQDSLSQNPRAAQKEPKALLMYKRLLDDVKDGDDQAIREILLYKTPFYYKGFIEEVSFFNEYWPGGYEDFLEKRKSINNE